MHLKKLKYAEKTFLLLLLPQLTLSLSRPTQAAKHQCNHLISHLGCEIGGEGRYIILHQATIQIRLIHPIRFICIYVSRTGEESSRHLLGSFALL